MTLKPLESAIHRKLKVHFHFLPNDATFCAAHILCDAVEVRDAILNLAMLMTGGKCDDGSTRGDTSVDT